MNFILIGTYIETKIGKKTILYSLMFSSIFTPSKDESLWNRTEI